MKKLIPTLLAVFMMNQPVQAQSFEVLDNYWMKVEANLSAVPADRQDELKSLATYIAKSIKADLGVAMAAFRRASLSNSSDREAREKVVGLLKQKEAALTRLRRHLRIRAMLEIWLYVHVPLTFALIAALSAHIISVFFYW